MSKKGFSVTAVAAVAFLTVWNCSAGWAADNKFSAGKAAQAEFLEIEFGEDVTLPSLAEGKRLTPRTLSAYTASISGVSAAKSEGTPVLVYFCVLAAGFELDGPKSRDINLKKQLKQCTRLEEKYFTGKDVQIGTLAKLFACIRVDVTCVLPGENRMFNAFAAPLVLIIPPDNSMVKLLSGKGVRKSSIMSEMTKVLSRKKINVAKALKNTKKILSSIRKLEGEKSVSEGASMGIASKIINLEMSKGKTSKNRIVEYIKKQEGLEAKLEALEEKLIVLYERFDAALRGPKGPQDKKEDKKEK